jgi:hypothetical protein
MKARSKPVKNSTRPTDAEPQSRQASEVLAQSPAKAKKGRKQSKAAAMRSGQAIALTHQQIQERARDIWLKSGCLPGRDDDNWREAETQLKAELGIH